MKGLFKEIVSKLNLKIIIQATGCGNDMEVARKIEETASGGASTGGPRRIGIQVMQA